METIQCRCARTVVLGNAATHFGRAAVLRSEACRCVVFVVVVVGVLVVVGVVFVVVGVLVVGVVVVVRCVVSIGMSQLGILSSSILLKSLQNSISKGVPLTSGFGCNNGGAKKPPINNRPGAVAAANFGVVVVGVVLVVVVKYCCGCAC